MFEEILAAMQAAANWCGVPVSNLTRDQYRAAHKAEVHNTSDSMIRELGTWDKIKKAAAAQEDFSTDTAAQVYKMSYQLKQLRKEKKLLLEQVGNLKASLEIVEHLENGTTTYAPAYEPPKSTLKRTAAAVAVLSDLHIEETVDPNAVEGVNDFDLDEAERRLERFFESLEWLIRHHRTSFEIDTLILALIGDLISGYIHEELVEVNSLSPTEAIVWLTDRILPGIEYILKRCKLQKIIIPCCFGNHGRTTHKTHISTLHKNNLELFVYDAIRRAFKDDDRVDVIIAQGELLYIDIFDFTLRFTHGDAIKGANQLVGPINAAAKKVVAWDSTRYADRTICGHWHRYSALPNLVINGSLIGFGPYAQHIGASYEEPVQAFFLMDSERGAIFDTPIWVRELTADARASA